MLPSFQALWDAYPKGESGAVKELIGGNVNLGWVTNTCAIRVSRALNYGGDPIRDTGAGVNTIRGGDGKRYIYRVAELRSYLTHKYGPPEIIRSPGAGKRGIIIFEVSIWSDATGHADLWDGNTCGGSCYWPQANEVVLWLAQ
jgi:hypothetical protein